MPALAARTRPASLRIEIPPARVGRSRVARKVAVRGFIVDGSVRRRRAPDKVRFAPASIPIRARRPSPSGSAVSVPPGCLSSSSPRYHCAMLEPICLPARDECVVRELLLRRAAEHPERDFVLFEGGEHWTYAEALRRVRRAAAGLDALGVRRGDLVLSWQANGPMAVTTFLALNFLGAVYVPINTSYRGAVLEHVVRKSRARLLIGDGRLLERLITVDRGALEAAVVIGDERPDVPGLALIPQDALDGDEDAAPRNEIAPWDTHMVIYTSGTTGPSKGVLSSYIHSYMAATGFRNIGPGDRTLMQLPMFHVGGPYALLWALIHAGSTVVVDAFSVSRFWELVRRFEITTVGLLGAMAQFLLKQPESPGDTRHPLRSVIVAPFDESAIAFGKRFGVPVYTEFNMTELCVPLWAGPNPKVPGTCGRPRPG